MSLDKTTYVVPQELVNDWLTVKAVDRKCFCFQCTWRHQIENNNIRSLLAQTALGTTVYADISSSKDQQVCSGFRSTNSLVTSASVWIRSSVGHVGQKLSMKIPLTLKNLVPFVLIHFTHCVGLLIRPRFTLRGTTSSKWTYCIFPVDFCSDLRVEQSSRRISSNPKNATCSFDSNPLIGFPLAISEMNLFIIWCSETRTS